MDYVETVTDHVQLRPIDLTDAEALSAVVSRNREHFAHAQSRRPQRFFTVHGQREYIQRRQQAAASGTGASFVIEVAGQIVGRIDVNDIVRGRFRSAHVGFIVDERWSGRGYAKAALAQVVRWARDTAGLRRLTALVDPSNIASRRVLRSQGFTERSAAATARLMTFERDLTTLEN